MASDNCPKCSGNTQLECLREYFVSGVSKLLQDTLDKAQNVTPEDQNRKESFAIELADYLLWLAASVYTEEGFYGSEAIYELARALEGVGSEPDDAENKDIEPTILDSNVN
jgi:hypothetical protein